MLIETSLTALLAEKVEVDEDNEAEELLDRSTVAVTSDAGTWKNKVSNRRQTDRR